MIRILQEQNSSQALAFRRHRHDVLNELQLIRAYLQMGQSEKALRVVDRTAEWLQSLTRWHANDAKLGEQLMWAASSCPNVVVSSVSIGNADQKVIEMFEQWIVDANEVLSQSGQRANISVRFQENGCSITLQKDIDATFIDTWKKRYPSLIFQDYGAV